MFSTYKILCPYSSKYEIVLFIDAKFVNIQNILWHLMTFSTLDTSAFNLFSQNFSPN